MQKLDNNNNIRRLVTLAEHTSDHGKQTNSTMIITVHDYMMLVNHSGIHLVIPGPGPNRHTSRAHICVECEFQVLA